MLIEVRDASYASLERALGEFKKKVKKAEIMGDLRKHEAYFKPSVKKKLKRIEARKRRRKEERELRRNLQRSNP